MVYNHTYMPMGYGRDPRDDYRALVERVTLWDVGAERQCELRGPEALALADHLAPRRLADLGGGRVPLHARSATGPARSCASASSFGRGTTSSGSRTPTSTSPCGRPGSRSRAATTRRWPRPTSRRSSSRARARPTCLGGLADADLAGVGRHRCAPMRIAGVEAVVSNTGWSREAGYEIYPLGSGRAGRALGCAVRRRRAARHARDRPEHRARGRAGHLRHAVRDQLGHEPDRGGDRRHARPRPRLRRRRRAARRARCTARRGGRSGSCATASRSRRWSRYWPVDDRRRRRGAGVARWAVYSFALERNIAVCLVDARLERGARAHSCRPRTGHGAASRTRCRSSSPSAPPWRSARARRPRTPPGR